MLYDKEFLLELDKSKNKIIYARITALTFSEAPIEYIEGRVTQGSINIDGTSAVRRTCSLTFVAQDFDYNNYYWGLNSKFKLEIGVQNFINPNYPDIIWFKQGIYLITGFNTSRSANNFTISISGKDKMCLLNGEVGGELESTIDFGSIDEENNDGIWVNRKIPIYDIIRNAVHVYGNEPYWNIIINDISDYGLELLKYNYDTPLYLYKPLNASYIENAIIDSRKIVSVYQILSSSSYKEVETNKTLKELSLSSDNEKYFLKPDALTSSGTKYCFSFSGSSKKYELIKVEFGDTVGYRRTDLTYAGDLISKPGDSVVSVLDKIKNMLVEFEYFYDLDGRFVFQKKKTFINTFWGTESADSILSFQYDFTKADYVFSGGELITTFNNNPNLSNVKNDFSIWGEKEGLQGAKIPIHMRYAIDKKPGRYTSISISSTNKQIKEYNQKHNLSIKGQRGVLYEKSNIYKEYYDEDNVLIKVECDWREIIYRMAMDYLKYNFLEDFELRVISANPDDFPSGQTGYENYYTDLQGFWRKIYYPCIDTDVKNLNTKIQTLQENNSGDSYTKETENRIEILKQQRDQLLASKENYIYPKTSTEPITSETYWTTDIYNPQRLVFWFDFLPGSGELQQFNVKNIGSRSKVINDTDIKAIYFRDTPTIEFTDTVNKEELSSHTLIQIGDFDNMFSISSQNKSAKEKLDELIYEHGYCIESATINTIPIYYLQPNSRVFLNDEKSGIVGYYNVTKISLPLTYNGTMSLTATRVQDN